ncbi:MAG TPA: ROK family protein [Kiritimatiellia bacterium]|nr:ROK family protein [Kiritimatiellia bacterium]
MSSSEERFAIGIDFGGTSVKLGLINDRGTLLDSTRIATGELKGKEAWLDAVAEGIEGLRGGRELAGIGVGVPGFVDHERGFIHDLPNVPGWTGVPLADLLHVRTGLKVRVDNDVNAMALGECTYGAGRSYEHAVFVTLGTGVGGGLLINNRLYRGAFSMAGEIGHVSIERNGIESPQGRGGVEQYVGNRRIVEYAIKQLESGRTSMLDELVGGDRSKLSPREIKAAAVAGDALALEVLTYMMDCLATAFASITYILQPQAFIVGGGVAEDADILFRILRERLDARLHPTFASRIELKRAELSNDAGMIGSATLALKE